MKPYKYMKGEERKQHQTGARWNCHMGKCTTRCPAAERLNKKVSSLRNAHTRRARRLANIAKLNAEQLEERSAAERKRIRKWKDNNRRRANGIARRDWMKRKYDITEEDYYNMFVAQSGECAMCPTVLPEDQFLEIDHCHGHTRVRGLLCSPCNKSLGHYERIKEVAEAYLQVNGNGNPLIYGKEPCNGTDQKSRRADQLPV